MTFQNVATALEERIAELAAMAKSESNLKFVPMSQLDWLASNCTVSDVCENTKLVAPDDENISNPVTIVYIKGRPVILEGFDRFMQLFLQKKAGIVAHILDTTFYFNYINMAR